MKKNIRLTEKQLHNVIKESVNRILSENDIYGFRPYNANFNHDNREDSARELSLKRGTVNTVPDRNAYKNGKKGDNDYSYDLDKYVNDRVKDTANDEYDSFNRHKDLNDYAPKDYFNRNKKMFR